MSLGAAAVVSGEEMQARALRSELGSVSGLSSVGRMGGGEVRASLGSRGHDGSGQRQGYGCHLPLLIQSLESLSLSPILRCPAL